MANDPKNYKEERKIEALKGGLAILAGILACITGFFTLQAALIGAKSNKGEPSTAVSNIREGTSILYSMAFSKNTLVGSLPAKDKPKPEPCPSPQAQVSAPVAAQPQVQVAPAETLSTDPKVLDSCTGLSPLTLEKVLVEAVPNGYTLSFRVKDDSKLGVSIWAEGVGTLNDSSGIIFPSGVTNLAQQYHIFDNTEQKALENVYNHGTMIQVGDSGSFVYRYQQQKELTSASTVTLIANLDFIFKDDANHLTYKRTSLSCQGVPVMRSIKN